MSRIDECIETESPSVVARDWGRGTGQRLRPGCRVSFEVLEKFWDQMVVAATHHAGV